METQLTSEMKRGLISFRPAMNSNLKTIRYAEEVWTPTGIVDFIRFEDYKAKDTSFCSIIDFDKNTESAKTLYKDDFIQHQGKCKIDGKAFPNSYCRGCVFKRSSYKVDMLVTCYECKITLSDFKSKNGHNFHGNKNYYVIPNYLYNGIKESVPEGIGIICYNPKTKKYKVKKECQFKEISHKLKEKLLYNAFKKWVDKCDKYYSIGDL